MSTLLAIGLANAITAAVLAIPAYLIGRSGRRPALAHALWLLVLVKLVTPPFFRVELPWLPPAPVPAVPMVVTRVEPTKVTPFVAPGQPDNVFLYTEAVIPGQPEATLPILERSVGRKPLATPPETLPAHLPAPVPEPPTTVSDTRDPFTLLLIVWALGGVFVLGRSAFFVWRFHALLRHARLAPDEVQQQTAALARDMGMKRSPAVWLVPGSLPPMVWAVGRACILFPSGLLDRLDSDARASLLVHELAHIRRRDHWVRWLEVVALGLYWWYPLAWLARRQLQAREEECCDAWAAGQVEPRVYATAILDAVDFLAEARPRLPALASPLGARHSLRERLTLVMTGTPARRLGWLGYVALLALAAVSFPMLPNLTRRAESAAPPPVVKADIEEAKTPEPLTFAAQGVNLDSGSDEVFSVDFSRDGKRIVAGMGNADRPGELQMWDLATRKSILSRKTARGIASVVFSPKSDRLAWAGWGGLGRVDEVSPLRRLFSLNLEGNNRLAYSDDGKYLAAAGENRQLRLLDAKDGRPITILRGVESMAYYSVAFSKSSKWLVAGGGSFNETAGPNLAHVFDVQSRKPIARLEGHALAVINVAFAPKDLALATASADSTVRIWDTKTFKVRLTLQGHTQAVKGLAFSPDGKTLATGSWDSTIRLWDCITGKEQAKLEGHPAAVREIAFSPDGKYLVSGGARRSVRLWDVAKRQLVTTLREDGAPTPATPDAVTLAVSGDGKLLATGTEDGKIILRERQSGQVVKSLNGHDDAVSTLVFSRDGTRLASSGPDRVVKVWEVPSGKLLHQLKGHENWVYALAFSGDGKTLASGSYDRTIRLWDAEAGKHLVTLDGHKASVRGLAFSPDNTLLASAGSDHFVSLWDVKERKLLEKLKGHRAAVRSVQFDREGKLLYSICEDGQLKRWDVKGRKELTSVRVHDGEAVALAVSPGGQTIATGGQEGNLKLWGARTLVLRSSIPADNEGVRTVAFAPDGQSLYSLGVARTVRAYPAIPGPVRLYEGHTGPVRIATYSPDGKYLLSAGGWPVGDKTLRLWDVKSGEQVRLFTTAKTHLQSACFTPDGQHAAAGADDGIIRLYEVSSGKEVRQFIGHKDGAIPHLTFSKDGKQMLSAGHDKTVRLWDTETGKLVRTFTGHTDWARCAIFLPDGKRFVSGGRDRTLRIWDIETGKLLETLDNDKQWVETLALLSDGKRVLCGGGDRMRLWDLEQGKVVREFTGHVYGVTSVAAAKDGRTALTTSYDGSTRLWDIESGAELRYYSHHRNWVWSVAIAPDGKTFATAGGGGQQDGQYVGGGDYGIRLWTMPQVR